MFLFYVPFTIKKLLRHIENPLCLNVLLPFNIWTIVNREFHPFTPLLVLILFMPLLAIILSLEGVLVDIQFGLGTFLASVECEMLKPCFEHYRSRLCKLQRHDGSG